MEYDNEGGEHEEKTALKQKVNGTLEETKGN